MNKCTCTLDNLCPIAQELMRIEGNEYKEFCDTKPVSINLWTAYKNATIARREHRKVLEGAR